MITRNGKKIASLAIAASIVFQNVSPIMALEDNEKQMAKDIIISEYIEGSGQNKAIELYNGTGKEVDLSEYKVELYLNGSATVSTTLNLEGTLSHDKTYIISHKDANEVIKSKADITWANMTHTGDDAIVIKKGDVVVDSFGKAGERPDKAWTSEDGSVSTMDMTLIRKSEISSGDTNTTDKFDPSIEWEAKKKDYTEDLGKHSMDVVLGEDAEAPKIGEISYDEEHNIIHDYEVSVKVTDNRKVKTVKLLYKAVGSEEFKELVLNYSGENTYSGIIAKEDLSVKGLVYYILAVDGYKNEAKSKEINVKISDLDITAPVISKLYPSNNFNTGSDLRPEIGADYSDTTEVDTTSVKIELDGVDVTKDAKVTKSSVKYIPSTDLKEGNHTVKVTLNDTVSVENATSKEWTFYVGEETLNHYYGNLHSHTNYSDGMGYATEAYEHARDKAKVDFLAITDHSNSFDNESKASMADGSMSEEWVEGHKIANEYNKSEDFTAIFGYEMSWSASTGKYGHMNTYNTPGFESRTNPDMNLKNYYETLKKHEGSISMFNHPGETFGDFSGFGHYDEEIDERITLIEVGNSDGAVGSNGYFPSYNEFINALDKGWHIAPTNGQDNHKGKWGDANTTRTVVLAEENSREALYQAMRDRRVYSTEDENLQLDFKINGNIMGTILEDTEELSFDVTVKDPDTTENSAKVEIVANGGKIVKSMRMTSNEQNFKFTLPSDYSYYFVKVTQADGQIAVSSPIWVGEVVSVGINSVTVDKDIVVENEEVNINTDIYNNESKTAENVKVEYFLNNETDDNKIETVNIGNMAATSSTKAPIKYVANKVGKQDIIVKVTMTVNGVEMVMNDKVSITVKEESTLSKLVIDASKQNYYVAGDYADAVNKVVKIAAENNARTTINKDKLTKEILEGVSLLVITDPQSKAVPSKGLTPQAYDADELAVIKEFVANGGNLVITSRADYGDSKEEIYQNSTQGNSVLEAIGSSIRFNDDQVIDKENFSNQNYRLYFNRYNKDAKLLEGIDAEKTFSFYSGCSVLVDPASNAEILIKGHETSESDDADKAGDATPVAKGDIVALASETLPGGGTVVVGGTTFFSDYELSDSASAAYSNGDIATNIIKQLAPKPELPVTKIAEVRKDEDNDNVADNRGRTFAIEGTVTVGTVKGAPVNSFFDCMYVQDETGGITIFGISEQSIKEGQRVRVEGYVDDYLGDTELALNNEFTDITILDENINKVEPKLLSTNDAMLESNEGLLVKVEGEVVRIEGQNIYVNDGSGIARAYVEGYVGSSSKGVVETGENAWSARIAVGDKVSIVGMSSEDGEEFAKRLRVRDTDEIVKLAEETPEQPEQPGTPDNGEGEDTTPEQPGTPDNGEGEDTTPEQPETPDNGEGEDTTPEQPETPDNGEVDSDEKEDNKGDDNNGETDSDKEESDEAPKTYDNGIGVMLLSGLSATGLLSFLSRRRKSNK
ncbi:CehA/McbA family metallohydrolase [Terrisporobacter sp.]